MNELDDTSYRPESDPRTVSYHVFHDMAGDRPLSSSVAMALTTLFESDGIATGPLAHTIDPDSLDRLFSSYASRRRPTEGMIRFVHDDVDVRITEDGHITLRTREPTR